MNRPNQAEKQRFQMEMQSPWEGVMTMLAADRPPAWEGFHFEARVKSGAEPGKFAIECKYGDRMSNRARGGVSRKIVDKIAGLHVAYLNFSPMMAWRAVTMEQIREPASGTWTYV